MASANYVQEIISHFAGYLQIFHDIARDRVHYEETSRAPSVPAIIRRFGRITIIAFVPDDLKIKGGPCRS